MGLCPNAQASEVKFLWRNSLLSTVVHSALWRGGRRSLRDRPTFDKTKGLSQKHVSWNSSVHEKKWVAFSPSPSRPAAAQSHCFGVDGVSAAWVRQWPFLTANEEDLGNKHVSSVSTWTKCWSSFALRLMSWLTQGLPSGSIELVSAKGDKDIVFPVMGFSYFVLYCVWVGGRDGCDVQKKASAECWASSSPAPPFLPGNKVSHWSYFIQSRWPGSSWDPPISAQHCSDCSPPSQ